MKFISNLSAHVFVENSKISMKNKTGKMEFSEFNLNGQIFSEYKNQDFLSTSSSMVNLYGVLFCTGIDLDDIMQIDCLA